MGKQIDGKPLSWPQTQAVAAQVQDKAIDQVLDLWHKGVKKIGYPPKWGDEVEYAIVGFDHRNRHAFLSMRQGEALKKLRASNNGVGEYTPEFTQYMVESEPKKPYQSNLRSILQVEENMTQRREQIRTQLNSDEYAFTLSIFPRLGAFDAFQSNRQPHVNESEPGCTQVPEDVVSREGRFQAAEENIRARRGRAVNVRIPLFMDSKTEDMVNLGTHKPARIIMGVRPFLEVEGTIFGPGHCGLQVTFQTKHETEARMLNDQFIPLGPIMLALTASTPMYRGYLVDTDTRWNQITQGVDDRNIKEEEGEKNGVNGNHSTSARWSANETYIAQDPRLRAEYHLQDLPISETAIKRLEEGGMDPLLARHFAHILIRDPIIIAEEDVQDSSNDPDQYNHYDSLSGTVWPHVRLKLPPPDDDKIGWRVEFRAMETQLTDFECAAFSIFIALMRLAIVHYNLNFYVPIEKVQENMEKAHERNAVFEQGFYFRRNIQPQSGQEPGTEEFAYMTIDEIINGASTPTIETFPGLMHIVKAYLATHGIDGDTDSQIGKYLNFVQKRASGKLWTAAKWMRAYVQSHEEYKSDSYVSKEICYDLMNEVRQIVQGKRDNRMFVE